MPERPRDLVGNAHSCGMIGGPAPPAGHGLRVKAGQGRVLTLDPIPSVRSHRVIAIALSPSQTKISPSPLGAGHPPGSRGRTYEGPLGESLGARYRIAHEAPRTAHIGRRRRRVDPAGARRALPIGGSPVATFATAEEFLRSDRPGTTACPARGDEEARLRASPAGL